MILFNDIVHQNRDQGPAMQVGILTPEKDSRGGGVGYNHAHAPPLDQRAMLSAGIAGNTLTFVS